jgi:hypothetical protein
LGIWYLVLGIGYWVLGIWYLVFGIWYLVFGIWYLGKTKAWPGLLCISNIKFAGSISHETAGDFTNFFGKNPNFRI